MGLTLIKALTASSSASLAFVDGTSDVVFDNTYNEYQFHFVNIHPQNDNVNFEFQVNATDDAGGGYDTSLIQSTWFHTYHGEDGVSTSLGYEAGYDTANAADYQTFTRGLGNAADESTSGILTIYDPSSTTYVKHFVANFSFSYHNAFAFVPHVAGYINDTTAIDEINFKMSSGNIDEGAIYMYGVS